MSQRFAVFAVALIAVVAGVLPIQLPPAISSGFDQPDAAAQYADARRAPVVQGLDTQALFAAGVSGGVWRSDDHGTSWRPIACRTLRSMHSPSIRINPM